jgi:hypothetical protein
LRLRDKGILSMAMLRWFIAIAAFSCCVALLGE